MAFMGSLCSPLPYIVHPREPGAGVLGGSMGSLWDLWYLYRIYGVSMGLYGIFGVSMGCMGFMGSPCSPLPYVVHPCEPGAGVLGGSEAQLPPPDGSARPPRQLSAAHEPLRPQQRLHHVLRAAVGDTGGHIGSYGVL